MINIACAGNPLEETTSSGVRHMLRESSHHILYFVANSLALNGFTADTSYNTGVANYVLMLIAIDIFILALLGLGLWLKLYGYKLKNDRCINAKALKKKTVLTIVYWSVVGVFLLTVIIVFFAWALPFYGKRLKFRNGFDNNTKRLLFMKREAF